MLETITRHRRALHQIPELDRFLPKTAGYILTELRRLDCEIISPGGSAVLAFFDGGKQTTIAFRSDMDALPISERTGLAYASTHPGNMHACGHDGHMAMLLTLAEMVNKNIQNLPANVLLVFQPAEETTGGAKEICETGVFTKYHVSKIYGIHLWPDLSPGTVATCAGAMMARASQITIKISGKSAHIAKSEEGRDALAAGVEFTHRLYQMAEEEIDPTARRVLKFGLMQSGSVRNAVSDHTLLEGSLRTFDDGIFETIKRRTEEIAEAVGKSTGCNIIVDFNEGYPPVINDKGLCDAVLAHLPGMVTKLEKPVMIAEDFSFYQREIPGLFFFLGIGGGEPLHSDKLVFDESALLHGVNLYEKLLYIG